MLKRRAVLYRLEKSLLCRVTSFLQDLVSISLHLPFITVLVRHIHRFILDLSLVAGSRRQHEHLFHFKSYLNTIRDSTLFGPTLTLFSSTLLSTWDDRCLICYTQLLRRKTSFLWGKTNRTGRSPFGYVDTDAYTLVGQGRVGMFGCYCEGKEIRSFLEDF